MLELTLDEINVFNRMEISQRERKLSFPPKLSDIMETVWTEPRLERTKPRLEKSPKPKLEMHRELQTSPREYIPSPRDYFDCLCDTDCQDELFLLPEQILNMDSYVVRDELSSLASSFVKNSPHNSLDSTDSCRSLRLLEDSEGFHLTRASDACRTLWICKFLFCQSSFVNQSSHGK
jgi:hypothetical protein